MPDGRFLSRSIAVSKQLASVPLETEAIFFRIVAFGDREGRVTGNVEDLLTTIAPRRAMLAGLTPDLLRAHLVALKAADLILWYSGYTGEGYTEVIQLPGFKRHQKGARFDREAASKFPSPDQVRSSPDEVLQREVKRSEVKRSKEKGRAPRAHPPVLSTSNGHKPAYLAIAEEKADAKRRSRAITNIRRIVANSPGHTPHQFPAAAWSDFSPFEREVISDAGGLVALWESR